MDKWKAGAYRQDIFIGGRGFTFANWKYKFFYLEFRVCQLLTFGNRKAKKIDTFENLPTADSIVSTNDLDEHRFLEPKLLGSLTMNVVKLTTLAKKWEFPQVTLLHIIHPSPFS